VRPVYKTRTATIGSPGTFPFADLKPANVGVPTGTVVMWSGNVNAIPAGWQLHLPLAGKFIVGYDPADADYDAIGKTGGEKEVTLTVNEMPSHSHREQVFTAKNNGGRKPVGFLNTANDFGDSGYDTGSTGGGLPHENRPPYYTLAYIIKL
jgi:hypothetical protein